jgi:hypothetical protein
MGSHISIADPITRLAALACAATWLTGCAAFNDVVVVDVGDQFRLVETDGTVSRQLLDGDGRGFECHFSATTTRSAWFAAERQIDGTIRCEPLPASAQ